MSRPIEKLNRKSSRYHHGDLRSALVELSGEELERVGAEGLALRSLAKELGVSQPSFYRHFSSKEALIDELAATGFADLYDMLALTIDASPRDRLLSLALSYFRFGLAKPQRYRLMFARPASEKHRDPRLAPMAEASRSALTAAVAEYLASVGRAEQNADGLALAIWSMCHGLILLISDGHLTSDTAEMQCRAAIECML
jgi:AcrR family transcriptional regulator